MQMVKDDRANPGVDTPAPTLRELAMVLFRQRKVFLAVSGFIFILVLLYAFFGASYRAEVRVLVRRGRSDPPVAAQQNAPPDFSRVEVTEEELNSEVEFLKDDDVLRQVVKDTNLASHDWLRWLRPHEEPAASEERAARRLGKRLKVESIKKTNLIAVSYEASDPQLAAQVLQSLSSADLEKHMEVHRPAGELHFFDQQMAESQEQLEQAKQKLLDFTKTHDVVAAGQQRDLILHRIDDVSENYRQTQVELTEAMHRIQELEKEMGELPARTTTQVRTADNPELLRSLKASLLDLQLKRIQLLNKFEPSNRLVQEVEQQIQQNQSAIAGEKATPVRDETTDKDVDYEWAKGELERARVDLKGLSAREQQTGTQLAQYRALARRLGEDAITQDALTSGEQAAQDNYLLYVKKREEARMGDALDQGGIVNVAVAERPVAPALPVWPAGGVAIVGFVAALVVGTGSAFTADYLDPALRTPEEVLACLEIPVLASLPGKNGRRLSA
jgi:uncharacterized protein involved in exopolysaccharide biosynthesis